jgi:hypothetical protein
MRSCAETVHRVIKDYDVRGLAKRMDWLAEGLAPVDATAADLALRLSGRMIELVDEGCLEGRP